MGVSASKNQRVAVRRQNYSYAPLPRMTNTFMLAGEQTPDEIIKSVKKGIYTKTLMAAKWILPTVSLSSIVLNHI